MIAGDLRFASPLLSVRRQSDAVGVGSSFTPTTSTRLPLFFSTCRIAPGAFMVALWSEARGVGSPRQDEETFTTVGRSDVGSS